MSDLDTQFHEAWIGLVQPIEGLVVSVPVLIDAQCVARNPPSLQTKLLELAPLLPKKAKDDEDKRAIRGLRELFVELLEFAPGLLDEGTALPEDLSLYVPEGQQTLKPTFALKKQRTDVRGPIDGVPDDSTPASRAGSAYVALAWDLPRGMAFDKSETATGAWDYPASAKFDRLLRACRVPIGILSNGIAVRLVYAPHGESSGSITFHVDHMATVGGRLILDAFVMLLHARRFFGVAEEHQLPAILRDSRTRQANVTGELAGQVFEAIAALLDGFEAAAERDGRALLDEALARDEDHLYAGLLTVLLRLVFLLYAEDRGLMPMEDPLYSEHLSVLGLFSDLQRDHGTHPDSMARRFGAWPRLVALFRVVFLGAKDGRFHVPARRGQLFDPHLYPFLEGWPGASAPITQADARGEVRVPTVDDGTIFTVLQKLLVLEGQRLSYRALDVEQIGSVYEALMGYHVVRLPSAATRIEEVWITGAEVLAEPAGRRAAYVEEATGLAKGVVAKLAVALKSSQTEDDVLAALEGTRTKRNARTRAPAGRLVIQPGVERRRTSSHYTPRSLSAPIVRRTLEPLLLAMGETPSSARLLDLKICDPAMGSGAFLVEACRFLADQVVAAWTREGNVAKIASVEGDVVNHARRLVAQRCLYGVDKNRFAVNLAKLSLWLVTLAKEEPFTFVDHALRHGDSLVGVSFDQVRAFHWKPSGQLDLFSGVLEEALKEAIALRQRILDLAGDHGTEVTREKEWLLGDAEDALDRVRLLGDVLIGAFFAHDKDKDREKERTRRLDLATAWLREGGAPTAELRALQAEMRAKTPAFHWMTEFPEVFFAERPDPLEDGAVNRVAFMDAFVGNPPFAGKNGISEVGGPSYLPWLQTIHHGAHGNADLSAHFFRRANELLGKHGTIGLIATNTIAQGDTRATGLQTMVHDGCEIYDATRSMLWPGAANVAVSVVHLAKGSVRQQTIGRRLDGANVDAISSRLRAKPERVDPVALAANASLSFVGSYVLGMGFTLTPEMRDALLAKNPRNAERIFPYLGGEEVNTSPTQDFDRYVINFGQMTLEEAEKWPDLLAIVREKVKPDRDTNNRDVRRIYWWRFGEVAPALYAAIAPLKRCLVTARVSKHLMVSFQPTDIVFSEQLYVFPIEQNARFSVLQSRIHEPWARLLSSSMRNDLRYSASDCFETFPFPPSEALSFESPLETIGECLYAARAKFMLDTNQGLTVTYNLLKDPRCDDPRITELRRLHEEMDRTVLAAYGWSDIEVPSFATTGAEKKRLEAFEDEVIDRLFALNAVRAEEERLVGSAAKAVKAPAKGKRAKKRDAGPQGGLPGIGG